MPLDTGDLPAGQGVHRADDDLSALRPIRVVLSETGHVGAALRAARESLGLAEEDIAQATRVRTPYIGAIEAFDLEALPARPFVVGYVRAYARALGVDAEAVVARFHAEAPRVDGQLRPPGGVRHDAFASIRWVLTIGAVLAAAVFAWNLWRHMDHSGPRAAVADAAPPRSSPSMGAARIGAPLPTPPEATTPPVYVTPGLAAAPSAGSNDGDVRAAVPGAAETGPVNAGPPFAPAGAIYGAAAPGAGVILQAHKSTTLVVRGGGGAVYFARLLAPGEAWRAPSVVGMTADVGNPQAVELFVGGASRGRLTQAQTALGHLDER